MNLWVAAPNYPKAAVVGLQAVEAFKLALLSAPEVSDELDLVQIYDHVGRRTAFLLLEQERSAEAIGVLQSSRGYSRNKLAAFTSIEDVATMSDSANVAVLYLIVGPDCTHAVIVDGRGKQTTLLHDKIDWIGGKQLIGLLTRISPHAPGLLLGQNSEGQIKQASLDYVFSSLEPLMTHIHIWLEEAGVGDLAIVPTGPYALLPFSAAPVVTDGRTVPFCSLHRCTTIPSAYNFKPAEGPLLPAILIAGEPVRPDLKRLHTRQECEGIRYAALGDGWTVKMLLYDKASSENIRKDAIGCSILHFAGHSQTDVMAPKNTVVSLSDGDVRLEEFGALLPQGLQLLVMSACQTGQTGPFGAPDENFGLPAIAIDAGVRIVLGSLWPVGDSATVRFMKNFYKALIQSISDGQEISAIRVADAMVYAQRNHGKSGLDQDPDYGSSRQWAAFQVFGL